MQNFKSLLIAFVATLVFTETAKTQQAFTLPQLPYSFEALEPVIDKETMQIHHGKHHNGYITNLNAAIQGTDAMNMSLVEILKNISKFSTGIRNNAGGHYNHTLFWTILTPQKTTMPSARLKTAIEKQFGGLDSLRMVMNKAGLTQFGSGWVWLCVDEKKQLFVVSTANQDNPLMDVVDKRGTPILGIDVWEHAYYLNYQNKRADYLNNIWQIINWDEVSRRYDELVPKGKFEDWPELLKFHEVMSQTFHPMEKGDLAPIRSRSGELVSRAEALHNSQIPTEFDSKKVKDAVKKLAANSKKLDKLVKSKASDKAITKALTDLHDVFHTIVGLCSDEENH